MTHEELKGALSAYFDGQLGPEQAGEVSAHLPGCPDCRAALEELRGLSTGIKKTLSAEAPAAMKARVLTGAGAKRSLSRPAMLLAGALAAIILALLAGVAAKRYMPAMFAQVQGMINAAAGALGDGDGR